MSINTNQTNNPNNFSSKKFSNFTQKQKKGIGFKILNQNEFANKLKLLIFMLEKIFNSKKKLLFFFKFSQNNFTLSPSISRTYFYQNTNSEKIFYPSKRLKNLATVFEDLNNKKVFKQNIHESNKKTFDFF